MKARTRKVLKEMLMEKTNNDHWWNKRLKPDKLDLMPTRRYKIVDGIVYMIVDTYKYLSEILLKDQLSDKIESKLYKECPDVNNSVEVNDFLVKNYGACFVINSYEYDSNLSQEIRYFKFSPKDGVDYIALQIHGGGDIRWGYTSPRVFKVLQCIQICSYVDLDCECGNELHSFNGYLDTTLPKFTDRCFIKNRVLYCKCGRVLAKSWI